MKSVWRIIYLYHGDVFESFVVSDSFKKNSGKGKSVENKVKKWFESSGREIHKIELIQHLSNII